MAIKLHFREIILLSYSSKQLANGRHKDFPAYRVSSAKGLQISLGLNICCALAGFIIVYLIWRISHSFLTTKQQVFYASVQGMLTSDSSASPSNQV